MGKKRVGDPEVGESALRSGGSATCVMARERAVEPGRLRVGKEAPAAASPPRIPREYREDCAEGGKLE